MDAADRGRRRGPGSAGTRRAKKRARMVAGKVGPLPSPRQPEQCAVVADAAAAAGPAGAGRAGPLIRPGDIGAAPVPGAERPEPPSGRADGRVEAVQMERQEAERLRARMLGDALCLLLSAEGAAGKRRRRGGGSKDAPAGGIAPAQGGQSKVVVTLHTRILFPFSDRPTPSALPTALENLRRAFADRFVVVAQ